MIHWSPDYKSTPQSLAKLAIKQRADQQESIPNSSAVEQPVFNREASGSSPDSGATKEKCLRHYVIVRSELTVKQKFAQIGHASGESAGLRTPPDDKTDFIALEGTLSEIEAVLPKLESKDFRFVRCIENAAPFAGQLVAIGIEPSTRSALTKTLYHFRAAGEDGP